jgi:hypothetical protein
MLRRVVLVAKSVGSPWQRGLLPRKTAALPSGGLALGRVRCQWRGFCVHRSEAETIDRRSARTSAVFRREGREKKRRTLAGTKDRALVGGAVSEICGGQNSCNVVAVERN